MLKMLDQSCPRACFCPQHTFCNLLLSCFYNVNTHAHDRLSIAHSYLQNFSTRCVVSVPWCRTGVLGGGECTTGFPQHVCIHTRQVKRNIIVTCHFTHHHATLFNLPLYIEVPLCIFLLNCHFVNSVILNFF